MNSEGEITFLIYQQMKSQGEITFLICEQMNSQGETTFFEQSRGDNFSTMCMLLPSLPSRILKHIDIKKATSLTINTVPIPILD